MEEFKNFEDEIEQLKILNQQKSCPMIHNSIVRLTYILNELKNTTNKTIVLERKNCGLHMKSHLQDEKVLKITYPNYPFDVPKEIWDKIK